MADIALPNDGKISADGVYTQKVSAGVRLAISISGDFGSGTAALKYRSRGAADADVDVPFKDSNGTAITMTSDDGFSVSHQQGDHRSEWRDKPGPDSSNHSRNLGEDPYRRTLHRPS